MTASTHAAMLDAEVAQMRNQPRHHPWQSAAARLLLTLCAATLLTSAALAVTLERGAILLLVDFDGRLLGGGRIERDGDLDFEILRSASGPMRFSVHYGDGLVLIYDAYLNDSNRLVIVGDDGTRTLNELARAHNLDLDYDRESELDDDIVCLVPASARSTWWPYGEDCD